MENTITNVNDLNINTDIHGLFDHTLNAYSKDTLSRVLITPLPNVEAIHHRQDIIRGFLCNQNLLEKYHYNGLDFSYVHAMLTAPDSTGLSPFRESMFFISTHMDELKDMASSTVDSYYLDCTLTDGIPKFSYQLKKGWSSVQIGKILFKNEGLYDIFQAHGAKQTE